MPSVIRQQRRAVQNQWGYVVVTEPEEQHDAYEDAKLKARNLLLSILPMVERQRMEDKGVVNVEGKMGTYIISPYAQTEIIKKGKNIAWSCMQLTIPAPTYDRMIAEYLLLKNDEALYWKKANIFPRHGSVTTRELAAQCGLIWLDTMLFAHGIIWLIDWFK